MKTDWLMIKIFIIEKLLKKNYSLLLIHCFLWIYKFHQFKSIYFSICYNYFELTKEKKLF